MESLNIPSKTFLVLLILSQTLGLTSIILSVVWLSGYWGGFDWNVPKLLFNFHPLFMVTGMVFLYGDAILVYRVFRNQRKTPIKILHGVLHILAFIFSVVGLVAVFKFHNAADIPNMFSLHSWLGVTTVAVFALQWVAGFITFLWPKLSLSLRASLLPKHVAVGTGLFFLAIAVCLTGITEKNIFSGVYPQLLVREKISNALAIFLVLFGGVVFYLLHNAEYRRVEHESPEHEALTG